MGASKKRSNSKLFKKSSKNRHKMTRMESKMKKKRNRNDGYS